MSTYLMAVRAIAWRSFRYCMTHPTVVMPGVVSPIFMLVAFVGGLNALSDLPTFVYPTGYVSFLFAAVLFIGAGFSGSIIGGTLALDFQTGFIRRLWLAPVHRSALLIGHALAAMVIALIVFIVLIGIGLLFGLQFDGTILDFVLLIVLALLFNLSANLWGAALALGFRSADGNMLANMPFLTGIFLAPLYVPLALLQGWVHTAANYNPVTALLQGARSLIAGGNADIITAFAVGASITLVISVISGLTLYTAARQP